METIMVVIGGINAVLLILILIRLYTGKKIDETYTDSMSQIAMDFEEDSDAE